LTRFTMHRPNSTIHVKYEDKSHHSPFYTRYRNIICFT